MTIQPSERFTNAKMHLTVLGVAILAGASLAMAEDSGPNVAASAPKVKVFIFAGQSNMVGRSDPKLLPKEYRDPIPGVRLYAGQAWRELSSPKGGQDGVGPEISAAKLLAATFPGEKIVIVKTAVGGTNLHTQWNPQRKNSLYARMLEDVKAATAGEEFEIKALFWAQGGADSKAEAPAKAYGKNLAAFIAQARKDLGQNDLPFIFSGSTKERPPSPKYPFMAEVNQGKAEVAKTVPHTALVSSDGLSHKADGIHYDTAGTIEFGQRFFEAWKIHFHTPEANPSDNIRK